MDLNEALDDIIKTGERYEGSHIPVSIDGESHTMVLLILAKQIKQLKEKVEQWEANQK